MIDWPSILVLFLTKSWPQHNTNKNKNNSTTQTTQVDRVVVLPIRFRSRYDVHKITLGRMLNTYIRLSRYQLLKKKPSTVAMVYLNGLSVQFLPCEKQKKRETTNKSIATEITSKLLVLVTKQ